jgi:O-antigen/teichoic acid export membrane protein
LSHFLTGNVLAKAFGFITMPILTRMLSTEEYGILGLATTTIMLSVAVAKAGLTNGIIRYYSQYSSTEEDRVVFSSSILSRGIVFSVVTFVLYVVSLPHIWPLLRVGDEYVECFLLISLCILLRPMSGMITSLMTVQGRSVLINVLGFVHRFVSFGLSLLLLFIMARKLFGFLLGGILSDVVFLGILYGWFFAHFRVNLKKTSGKLVAALVKFGMPLLLMEMAFLLLSYADRYMIIYYLGEDPLGVYTVGYNLAMYIADILVFSISFSIVPIYVALYEQEGREGTEAFLRRCLDYLLMAFIPMAFGYVAVCREAITLIASAKYVASADFSPIILVASFVLGLSTNILTAGLYLQKKTGTMLGIMIVGVVTNIGCNVLLLPEYGVMGAAVSTLVACLLVTVITVAISYRHIFVAVKMGTLVYYSLVSLLMVGVIERIVIDTILWSLLAKVGTGIGIVGIGFLIREREAVAALRAMWQRRSR